MAERTIKVEAETLEEARKQVKSQVSKDLQILSEKILSDGKIKSIIGVADTIEEAYKEAESKIPPEGEVIEKQEIQGPMRKVVTVEAFDEQNARTQTEQNMNKTARIEEVKLKKLGKKGFLGRGKKPNHYEAQIFEQAVVEIKHKKKARIHVELRESPESWVQKLENKDYHTLTNLKIIEKDDPRFSRKLYDKGHDLYLTPLEFENPYGGASSLNSLQENLQRTVQEILKFWKKPKQSYSVGFKRDYELNHDELRIRRIETFRDLSVNDSIMYVVRLGENSFFSWTRIAR